VARATGPYRPATRRTERVRRSFSQRTPFVIGALSFFRHLTFVIRHSQTETIVKPLKYHFLRFETAMNGPQACPPSTPPTFVIGASSFFRHLTFVIRHSQTETIKNPRNITFLQMKPHPTTTQRIAANPWVVGRVTPCAPLLTSKSASYPSCHFPNAFLNT